MDFGMALSRGMIPKDPLAQQDLLDLAGGRNIFKSEDWWQKQVDKQVKEGYRRPAYTTLFLTQSGQYKPSYTTHSGGTSQYYDFQFPDRSLAYIGKSFLDPQGLYALERSTGSQKQESAIYDVNIQGAPAISAANLAKRDPKTNLPLMKLITDFSKGGRVSFSAPELKDVTAESKRGTEQIKRTTAEEQQARRRLTRGARGAVAKAMQAGGQPATGLPSLGDGGLGYQSTLLGQETKL